MTFGCLNRPTKVTDATAALFAAALAAVPGSTLLLLAGGSENAHLAGRLGRHGVARDRVEFAPRVPRRAYLDLYARIDVALDPAPYNGDTTVLDALLMGAATVTLTGDRFVGRRGLSHLANVGLEDLCVAGSPGEYAAKAAALAGDVDRLRTLRHTLRDRLLASPLGDAGRYTRDLEAAYRRMWARWRGRTG